MTGVTWSGREMRSGIIGCVEMKKAAMVWAMSREGLRKNHLIQSWNSKSLEDILRGRVEKSWRKIVETYMGLVGASEIDALNRAKWKKQISRQTP